MGLNCSLNVHLRTLRLLEGLTVSQCSEYQLARKKWSQPQATVIENNNLNQNVRNFSLLRAFVDKILKHKDHIYILSKVSTAVSTQKQKQLKKNQNQQQQQT